MVLTQLDIVKVQDVDNVFPYHYGSHATNKISACGMQAKGFPYHYGSHATIVPPICERLSYWFPYHYGSHATKEPGCYTITKIVSIPLWFSRNLSGSQYK